MFFSKKYNILITGANGQLGSYLFNVYRKLSFQKNSQIGHVFGISRNDLDLTSRSDVTNFFNKNVVDPPIDIDYVIHCAACSNTTLAEQHPNLTYRDNVLATMNVAESCAYNKIKMIFISSDYVFSEIDQPDDSACFPIERPVNQYGFQKLLAEKYVKEAYGNWTDGYMILRPSWIFGNSSNSFIEKFLKNACDRFVKANSGDDEEDPIFVNVDGDAYGRPTSCAFLAAFILNLIVNKCSGIISAQPPIPQISRAVYAKKILREMKYILKTTTLKVSNECLNFIIESLERTEVNAVSEGTLNLPLQHPGKFPSLSYVYTQPGNKKARLIEQLATESMCTKTIDEHIRDYLTNKIHTLVKDIYVPIFDTKDNCKNPYSSNA